MAAPSVEAPHARTYGNFRRPQSAGLGQLGTLGTAGLCTGLVLVIVTMMVAGLLPAVGLLLAGGAFLGTLSVRGRHGRTLLQGIGERAAWTQTRARGEHVYRAGPLGRVPGGAFRLPGLAAASTVTEHEDVYARPFALVHWPSTRHCTVVLASEPDGASLVDDDQIDLWVAHYGAFLAQLGDEPGLVAASATIETAPDSGTRLRREVERSIDPHAPAVARAMLGQVVDTYPAGSASVRAMVALTFSAAGRGVSRAARLVPGAPRTAEAMARDLGYRVHTLGNLLQKSGAGATRPMSAQALAEEIRTAYDPDAARVFEHARAQGDVARLDWGNVGPAAAEARWDSYRHDGGVSCTWSMTQAPRGELTSGCLAALLRPHPDIARKRVTVLYRPLDRGRAATVVERDKRNADFRVSGSKRPSSRAIADQRSAHAVAEEEARGAGLVDFAMLATATVVDPANMEHARQAVAQLAPTARVQLRPVYGSQDSAFAAALPLGIVLASHLKVPDQVREAL